MRKGRFKYSLISKSDFHRIKEQVNEKLLVCRNSYLNSEIRASELVAEYLFQVLIHLRPKDYLGAIRKVPFAIPATSGTIPRHDIRGRGIMSALECFSKYSMRSIPEGALKALCSWASGQIQLEFLFNKPSAESVLKLQSEGRRVLTLFMDQQGLIDSFDEGRDPYSFTIHDLVHADLFFHDEDQYQKQIEFFRFVEDWKQCEAVEQGLQSNIEFKKALDYISSDMNSHSSHMWSYFQHMVAEYLGALSVEMVPADLAGAVQKYCQKQVQRSF